MGETLGKLVALLRSPEGQENAQAEAPRRNRYGTERPSGCLAPYEFVTAALALRNPS
jgi:hypothetical protein